MKLRTAVILGATGLVGGNCLQLLLQDSHYKQVLALGRRAAPVQHTKLVQHEVNLAQPETYAHWLGPQTDFFCCLGTTIATAGSEEAFRQVDYTYPLTVARAGAQHADNHWLMVSSLGADAKSALFYSRVKGEIERDVARLSFAGVHILQPSLLLGERAEFRLGEKIAEIAALPLGLLMVGPLRKYRPIEAATVARAMQSIAHTGRAGLEIIVSDKLAELGENH